MNNRNILFLAALIGAFLFGNLVLGNFIFTVLIPSTGEIVEVTVTVSWLNGTEVTSLDWGATENSTEYVMEPLNITNTSNVPVNLTLSTSNHSPSTIIALTLTWNYTGAPLQPNNSEVIELYQNVTATGRYTYETVITATPS